VFVAALTEHALMKVSEDAISFAAPPTAKGLPQRLPADKPTRDRPGDWRGENRGRVPRGRSDEIVKEDPEAVGPWAELVSQ
jgi:hypothetical protein